MTMLCIKNRNNIEYQIKNTCRFMKINVFRCCPVFNEICIQEIEKLIMEKFYFNVLRFYIFHLQRVFCT